MLKIINFTECKLCFNEINGKKSYRVCALIKEVENLKSPRVHVYSCPILSDPMDCSCLWSHELWATRLLCPWDSSGKNTEVACHFLLNGIFLTQGLNPHLLHLLHWQVGSFPLHHMGSPKKKPYTHLLNWICGWGISYIAFIKAPYGEFIKYLNKNNADIL